MADGLSLLSTQCFVSRQLVNQGEVPTRSRQSLTPGLGWMGSPGKTSVPNPGDAGGKQREAKGCRAPSSAPILQVPTVQGRAPQQHTKKVREHSSAPEGLLPSTMRVATPPPAPSRALRHRVQREGSAGSQPPTRPQLYVQQQQQVQNRKINALPTPSPLLPPSPPTASRTAVGRRSSPAALLPAQGLHPRTTGGRFGAPQ